MHHFDKGNENLFVIIFCLRGAMRLSTVKYTGIGGRQTIMWGGGRR